MRTETRTIMVPNSKRVYIANDGTEFSRYIECVNHELDAYRNGLSRAMMSLSARSFSTALRSMAKSILQRVIIDGLSH